MDKKKLSIIVPIYNSEKYIADCLDSLIDQGFNNAEYEVLCIDDGSTDQSADIVREYAYKNSCIKLFRKDNGGIASTRNFGLFHASGKYITFVDSDDFLASNSLAKMIRHIEKTGSPMISFSYECVDEGACYNFSEEMGLNFYSEKISTKVAPLQVWGMIVEKKAIEKCRIKFNESFRTREDYIFNLQLFATYYGVSQEKTQSRIYKYRVRKGSLSHIMDYKSEKFQEERMENMIGYVKECLEYLKNNPKCNENTHNEIERIAAYYSATALLSCLRCKKVNALKTQQYIRELGYYPYPIKYINSLNAFIKAIITCPGIFNVLAFFNVLSFRTLK